MSDEIRKVRALRLRVPDPAVVQRGRLLIEDALHVADVPAGRGGRTLLVRRLDLGRIHANGSSASIALRIEERIGQLAAAAVHAASPEAEAASAVFFSGPAEPLVTLALRAAAGRDTEAWFWRAAFPPLRAAKSHSEILRLVLRELASRPEAPAAMAQLTRALLQERTSDALVAALLPEDGPVLMRALGIAPRSPVLEQAAPSEHAARSKPRVGATARTTLIAALRAWGSGDARALWLAAALVAAEHSTPLPAARLRASAAALMESIDVPLPAPSAQSSALDTPVNATFFRQTELPHSRLAGKDTPFMKLARDRVAPQDFPAAEDRSAGDAGSASQDAAEDLASTYGGLLFAVNALARLGLGSWLEAHPAAAEHGFALVLLRELALAAQCPPHDAVLLALAAPEAMERMLAEAAGEARAILAWRRAVRRWVRRRAGIGLAALIQRNARVQATPTHLDVFFDSGEVDIRVRRCGLDLDPGWVPWLGKVVSFHYGSLA